MKQTALTIILLAFACCALLALPAKPGVITRTLPDGSTISLTIHGDEHFSFLTTSDGYLVKEMPDGFYQYAEMNSGIVTPLGVRAADSNRRTPADNALLASKGMFQMSDAQFAQSHRTTPRNNIRKAPAKRTPAGTKSFERNLVILVNFSDLSCIYPQSEFNNMLNQQGYSSYGATGSIRQYFSDNSYNAFQPQFDVYGPYTLSNNEAYYGAHDGSSSDVRPAQMVLDAVRMLDADVDADVDFSVYDNDGDGYIDNVFIIYAGHPESSGGGDNTIWPHRWIVYPDYNVSSSTWEYQTFDGVTLYDYGCSSELRGATGTSLCGIGAFCHEYSHLLGLADLYVTDGSSSHKSVGDWDLMCGGCYNNDEHTPAGYSMFERYYLGWTTPVILNRAATETMSSSFTTNQSYIITSTGATNGLGNDPDPDTYFLLENRQNTNWDTHIPGHGMIITKVTWDQDTWDSNGPNNDPNNMVVDMIEAGGSTVENGSDSDPFPGTSNVTAYTPYTNYPITNIRENAGSITFDFMGGNDGTFTVNFDGGKLGVADVESIKQDTVGAPIILPAATPNDTSYQFEGWSSDISASMVDVGDSGDIYIPTDNTILYAVYSYNGTIIPVYFDTCMTDNFSHIPNNHGQDITDDINSYTDLNGWSGSKLLTNYDWLTVAPENDTTKAYIMTPPTGMVGTLEVAVIARHESSAYLGVVADDQSAADYQMLSAGEGILYFTLNKVTANARLKISSDLMDFDIQAVYICGDPMPEPAAVQTVSEANEPQLIRRDVIGGMARIVNLQPGVVIRIVDIMGRVLSTTVADSDEYEFNAPDCFYVIQVECGGNLFVLK